MLLDQFIKALAHSGCIIREGVKRPSIFSGTAVKERFWQLLHDRPDLSKRDVYKQAVMDVATEGLSSEE